MVNIVIKYTNTSGTNVSLEVIKENGMTESEILLECEFTNSRVDFFVEFTFQCGMKTITDTTSPCKSSSIPTTVKSFYSYKLQYFT